MVKKNGISELPGTEIVAKNLRAVQTIYIAAMLEELKMFQVVDRLAQLFQLGILAVNRESAGRGLYKYLKETPLRLSETQRRNLFSITLGVAGGTDGAMVNREFNDLWLRFISSAATLKRERTRVESAGSTVDELSVKRAATDLARNLSLHGGGMALYAALELQQQIQKSIRLLSEPEIKSAYGARDAWQVIEQVATIDFAGAANASKFRTMAITGSTIISWLAANLSRLRPTTQRPLFRFGKSASAQAHLVEFQFSARASDNDLANACEQWLAVNGVTDDQIEQQLQTEKPIRGTTAT
jgi:hypothetical protein